MGRACEVSWVVRSGATSCKGGSCRIAWFSNHIIHPHRLFPPYAFPPLYGMVAVLNGSKILNDKVLSEFILLTITTDRQGWFRLSSSGDCELSVLLGLRKVQGADACRSGAYFASNLQ